MAFSEPNKIIEQVGIQEGASVADLGAGSGFYSMAAAQAVGPQGRVYAIDIQQELLTRLKTTANQQRIHNIEVLHGDIEHIGGTRIREASVDLVIAANVMFQLDNKEGLIEEAKRILKPNGRLLIVDWTDSFGGLGPQGDMVFAQTDAKKLCEAKGLAFATGVVAGDHHYGLIFRKS
jgi:ubiquinone/menaquinone biosynthesis C-methylase UbiE